MQSESDSHFRSNFFKFFVSMLNRRHIRIKVMQVLYAFGGTESDDFSKDQKFLLFSIDNMYNLYLLLISLMIEVHKRSENHLEKTSKKHLATQEEKNPNRKFVNNQVLVLLKNNEQLQAKLDAQHINNWELDTEYVDLIFKKILASDIYKNYLETKTSDFKEDRDFIVDVFKEIIAPNEKLYDYLEDKHLTWLDDLPTVNTTILKLLRKVKKDSTAFHFLPKLYKDIEDAITLNADKGELTQSLIKGVGKKTYGKVSNGIFTPVNISKNVIKGFQQITNEIQEVDPSFKNPLLDSLGAIYNIRGQLFNVGLEEDEFLPEIDNPFDTPPIPDVIQEVLGQLPPVVSGATPSVVNANAKFGSIPTIAGQTDPEEFNKVFPNG